MDKPVAQAPEKAAPEEKHLDEKELELERERKQKKEQKAREKEEKKLKAKQKEAARLQAQATSDGPKKSEKKQKKKAAEDENPEDFIDPETPSGEKKLLAPQMAKQYNPSAVEKSWYAWWESAGYFGADPTSSKPPFVIVLPPPNVTGALHIGHALTVAIEDAMIRWQRMSGYNALWVPGVDHAGIATQVCILALVHYQLNFIFWKTYTDNIIEFLITSLVALAVIQLMKHTSTHHADSVNC